MRHLFSNDRVDFSGATTYSLDLATGLMARGDEVRLVTRGGALEPDFAARGIKVYRYRSDWLSRWKLNDFLREYSPDMVHAQSLDSFRLASRLASSVHRPLVLTVHRRPPRSPDGTPPTPPARPASGVIVLNEVIREALVNDFGWPKASLRLIRRGVQIPEGPDPVGLDWVASGRLPIVGSIGRYAHEKGQDLLIRAGRRILDAGGEAHFALVGEGPEEGALRRLTRELDLEDRVTFAPPLPNRRGLFELFDLVALPVRSHGVGVTALEVLAMGRPLVASAVGELLHLIEDGTTGLLVPEDDDEALAERLLGLLESPARAIELGRAGRVWAEKNARLDTMVDETRAYYAELLEEAPSGGSSTASARR